MDRCESHTHQWEQLHDNTRCSRSEETLLPQEGSEGSGWSRCPIAIKIEQETSHHQGEGSTCIQARNGGTATRQALLNEAVARSLAYCVSLTPLSLTHTFSFYHRSTKFTLVVPGLSWSRTSGQSQKMRLYGKR